MLGELWNYDVLGVLIILDIIEHVDELRSAVAWLVLQGEDVVRTIARDPQKTVDLDCDWMVTPGLDEVAARLYKVKTGQALTRNLPATPAGEPWAEGEDLENRFPYVLEKLAGLEEPEEPRTDYTFEAPELEGIENVASQLAIHARGVRFGLDGRHFLLCDLTIPIDDSEYPNLILGVWVKVNETDCRAFTSTNEPKPIKGRLRNRVPGIAETDEEVTIIKSQGRRAILFRPRGGRPGIVRSADEETIRKLRAYLCARDAFRAARELSSEPVIPVFRNGQWTTLGSPDEIRVDDLTISSCVQCRSENGILAGNLWGSCPICAGLAYHSYDVGGKPLTLADEDAERLGVSRLPLPEKGSEDVSNDSGYTRVDLGGHIRIDLALVEDEETSAH